jgi:endonuclease YncB( thermonuclease family)
VAAKGAVVDGVKGASVASVSVGGSLIRRTWLGFKTGVWSLASSIGAAIIFLRDGIVVGLVSMGRGMTRVMAPLAPMFDRTLAQLGRRPIRLALILAAAAALTWSLSRFRVRGWDTEVTLTASVAAVCAAAALLPIVFPLVQRALTPVGRQVSRLLVRLPFDPMLVRGAVYGLAGLGLIAGALYLVGRGTMTHSLASLPALPRLGVMGPPEISGRAMAISGDTIRLDGRLIGLVGVEAPLLGQRCVRGANKNWRCGVTATEALNQKIRREVVTCAPTGREERGRQMARCRVGNEDLAGLLVKEGAVFASSGLFSQYGSLEGAAKAQKVGLWSGEAERPDTWRTKLYEEAKKRAPNQCPVKGVKGGTGLRYVMPWEDDYEKVRVREGRGERWFCSEQEAQSAGYRLAS